LVVVVHEEGILKNAAMENQIEYLVLLY